MGRFTIRYTRARSLDYLNLLKCEEALQESKEVLKDKIKKIKKIKNFTTTSDFKKYGMYPGQQIRRYAKKIIPHAAIYIYDGLVLEMGAGPKKCSRVLGNPLFIHNHVSGLTTLTTFKNLARKEKVTVYKIKTSEDSDPREIKKRLKRTLDVVGKYKYNVLWNNCLHMADFVTYGKKRLPAYIRIIKDQIFKKKISEHRQKRRSRRR
jgi:hypothetical protein